ncbi:LexA family protein [Roseospira marina]|nr:S24 family peptidase [Roseospira marina]
MRKTAHHGYMETGKIRRRQIAFVKAAQEATGLDTTNMARRIGRAPSTLNRFIKPTASNCLSAPVIAALERLSGLSYSDFDDMSRERNATPLLMPSLEIPVIGEVQAGVWKMEFEIPLEEREFVSISHPGGPDVQYFGLRVVGDSMDLVYPPGTVLICVGRMEFWDDIRHGEHVIVQRRSRDSAECEYTVKELQRAPDGAFWLVPRSSNPAHQAPIRCEGWDHEQPQAGNGDIEVIGIVVGEYRWRHRPQ